MDFDLLEKYADLIEIDEKTGCWNWLGRKHNHGEYGIASTPNGYSSLAHRFFYQLFVGEIPDSLHCCHRCDNPKCCYPHHIFLGTDQDNTDDKISKGRQCKGETHGKSKLSLEQVNEILESSDTQKNLALIYKVSQQQISRIKRKQRWV